MILADIIFHSVYLTLDTVYGSKVTPALIRDDHNLSGNCPVEFLNLWQNLQVVETFP